MTFITLLQLEEQDYWFQQDGATARTANSTILLLHSVCSDHFSSSNSWSFRFPNLTTLDFYHWGFLKENINKNSLHIFEELTQNIQLCISSIMEESVHWVASNMRKGLNACIAERIRYFKHFI
jgi:hypothetical protein